MAILNLEAINEIFDKVQKTSICHKKLLKSLEQLYTSMNIDDFTRRFLLCLKNCLVQEPTHNPYVNRTFTFCVDFCVMLQPITEDEISCPFLSKVFECVLKYNSMEKAKYRVCQFINMLLKKLREENCFLDEKICDAILDVMLVHVEDKTKLIRLQAVEAMEGLQNTTDPNDPVIQSYIVGLADNIPQVRKAIVKCIGVNLSTIPIIIGRCLDIDDNVKLSAYERLSKISILHLTLVQRQKVLRYGFKDKSPKVQAFIANDLVLKWFERCGKNYLEYIRKLKLDADENDFKQSIDIIEKVLEIMFSSNPLSESMKVLPLGSENIVDTGEISWELIVFWRCLIRFLQKTDHTNDYVEQIMPDLTTFCKFTLRIYNTRNTCSSEWEIMQHDQIILELIKMSKEFDFSEEVGRRNIHAMITDILTDAKISYATIQQMLQIFELLIPNENERITQICTIISEIREPMVSTAVPESALQKHASELAHYKVKILEAINVQEAAVEEKDFAKAQEMKEQIVEYKRIMEEKQQSLESNAKQTKVIRSDPATLIKCLDILIALLTLSKSKSLPPTLKLLQETFIQPLLESDYPEMFQRAYQVLGLCCVIDEDLARRNANVFFSSLWYKRTCASYDEQNTLIAINTVTDMILLYGRDIFGKKDADMTQNTSKRNRLMSNNMADSILVIPTNYSYEDIIEILSEMFDYEHHELREAAGNSIIKLMCNGVIQSPTLFSKLLLNWFNPATGKDSRLRQLMGLMFLEYARQVPESLEVIEMAFMPTISVLVDAPLGSPLCDVDIDSAIRFMLQLCRTVQQKPIASVDSHKNLAVLIGNEICTQPKKQYTFAYLKALIHLEPPFENEAAISDLIKQADNIISTVKDDKRALRYAQKYKSKLEGNLDQADTGISTTTAIENSTVNEYTTSLSADSAKENEEPNTSTKYSGLSVQKRKKRNTSVANLQILSTVDESHAESDPVTPPSTPESQTSPRHLSKRRCIVVVDRII